MFSEKKPKKVLKEVTCFFNRIGFWNINLNTFITLGFEACQEGSALIFWNNEFFLLMVFKNFWRDEQSFLFDLESAEKAFFRPDSRILPRSLFLVCP